ncbi:DUF5688 family protein [Pseudobutyrivibrio sp. MD2005]|uniref:DUF5688 family protein n=1 Tax=Pseudobutyrivibrio sp. MD2005 TaxID=1410616 RepID=UPI0004815CB0|nr:DUF5688 family protein [Pseudobutyrivibrio sp. MD2005]
MANEKFNNSKNSIVFKVINKEKNAEILAQVPYMEYLDLAIVFYMVLPGYEFEEEKKAALIFNEIAEVWDVTAADLMEAASVNTPRIMGLKIGGILSTIADYLHDDSFSEIAEIEDESVPLYVATNEMAFNGAAVILYKDMLKAMSAKLKADLFVIPCSVHEVILVKVIKGCQMDTEDLKNMISYVNESSVPENDVLSDSLYYYSRETDSLCIA